MMRINARYYFMLMIIGVVCLVIASCSSIPTRKDTYQLSKLQIQRLAERILENTPEYVHFAPGAKFSWVLISLATKSNTPELHKEVIMRLKKKYIVYFNSAEIPKENLYYGSKGELIGYKDGFSFGFRAEIEKEGSIKIQYYDWEGNLGGSNHWTRYKWMGTYWDVIEKSQLVVS